MKRLSTAFTALLLLSAASFQASAAPKKSQVTFNLSVNPKIAACLADESGEAPDASVTVVRGDLNDHLLLTTHHIKPGLQFDVFTVQRSSLKADGTVDPNVKNFGFAWYQSDLESRISRSGIPEAHIDLRSIFLDQIFGFDPDFAVPPINTFHVGFWFNNPADAAACGFDVTKPTPFNGEHKAGPVAMISTPDPVTGLGPLCTDLDPNHPGACNP